jgi:hypothetical protein
VVRVGVEAARVEVQVAADVGVARGQSHTFVGFVDEVPENPRVVVFAEGALAPVFGAVEVRAVDEARPVGPVFYKEVGADWGGGLPGWARVGEGGGAC